MKQMIPKGRPENKVLISRILIPSEFRSAGESLQLGIYRVLKEPRIPKNEGGDNFLKI